MPAVIALLVASVNSVDLTTCYFIFHTESHCHIGNVNNDVSVTHGKVSTATGEVS